MNAANEPSDVRALRGEAARGAPDDLVRVIGLRKVYPSRNGMPPKLAVKDLHLAVRRGECFGFLGWATAALLRRHARPCATRTLTHARATDPTVRARAHR